MELDRSFGLHAICVRVGAGHKERGHKNGVSFRIHGIVCNPPTNKHRDKRPISTAMTFAALCRLILGSS
jgi:hypothetical protein